jgi:Fe-S cluster biogenesis protein NfuA
MSINKEEVEKVLDEISPMLRADGGGVELVGVDEEKGRVKVKLTGACHGCPMSAITLKEGIEKTLKEKIKDVKEVLAL